MQRFVVATTNLHKLREIRALLGTALPVEIVSLWDYPDYHPPEEEGESCEENAILKARFAAEQLGEWVLADDSALVVPALGGEPGVHSARYAGEGATDRNNRRKLLQAMANLTDLQRAAYFECWLALAGPEGVVKTVRGVCEGEILTEERGAQGFGYDPIFRKHGYSKSLAELSDEVKNRISHRSHALEKIVRSIEHNILPS
jgi:XTP/dITP diphosphohydrolase